MDLKPLLVVNVTGTKMSFSRLHQPYENKSEAVVVQVIYSTLFSSSFEDALAGDSSLTHKDVCVITPYNRHKDCLRMLICGIDEDALDSYEGHTFGDGGKPRGYSQSPSSHLSRSLSLNSPQSPQRKKSQAVFSQEQVDEDEIAAAENIDTVGKFQGSERRVVIISTCVDQKPLRSADPHFITVACSRAKHLLLVVGNFTNGLSTNSDWMFVRDQSIKEGSYIDHTVTLMEEDGYDINKNELERKLKELVEQPRKKAAR